MSSVDPDRIRAVLDANLAKARKVLDEAQAAYQRAEAEHKEGLRRLDEFESWARRWDRVEVSPEVAPTLPANRQRPAHTNKPSRDRNEEINGEPTAPPEGIRPAIREALRFYYPRAVSLDDILGYIGKRYPGFDPGRRNVSWALHRMTHRNKELEITPSNIPTQSAVYKLKQPNHLYKTESDDREEQN